MEQTQSTTLTTGQKVKLVAWYVGLAIFIVTIGQDGGRLVLEIALGVAAGLQLNAFLKS
jgi:hypothetical protein